MSLIALVMLCRTSEMIWLRCVRRQLKNLSIYVELGLVVFLVCHRVFNLLSSNPYHLLRARFSVLDPERIPDRDTKPVPCYKPIKEKLHILYDFFDCQQFAEQLSENYC